MYRHPYKFGILLIHFLRELFHKCLLSDSHISIEMNILVYIFGYWWYFTE